MNARNHIFLLYARDDGADFADRLRKGLEQRGFSISCNLALEDGQDWLSKVEKALKSEDLLHVIVALTPSALTSPSLRRVVRVARREGQPVSSINGPGVAGGLYGKTYWIGKVWDLRWQEERPLFRRLLEAPGRSRRAPMTAPQPPAGFIARPEEFNAVKQQLVDDKGEAAAVTVVLKGAGGSGKTALAQALAHDADVQDAYPDGVLWVDLGEKPDELLSKVTGLIAMATGERVGFPNLGVAMQKLTYGDQNILLIIDNVRRPQMLKPFLTNGPRVSRIVVTRLHEIQPDEAVRQAVSAMKPDEAWRLLAAGLPGGEAMENESQLASLAARLGEWPQLLKLVNGFLRRCCAKSELGLAAAVARAGEKLDEEGFDGFDASRADGFGEAAAQIMSVNCEFLGDDDRARFEELGVFPECVDIPFGVVARLWSETGGLGEGETEKLLGELFDLSLLLPMDGAGRAFRLNSTTRDFLRERINGEALAKLHGALLKGLEGAGGRPSLDSETRRYYYLHRLEHLAEGGEQKAVEALLLDPAWLTKKIEAIGDPALLMDDYKLSAGGWEQFSVAKALGLSASAIARDSRQLLPQLLDRLMCDEDQMAPEFVKAAHRQLAFPALVSVRPGLTPPSMEAARLEGHQRRVNTVISLADGRLASASSEAIRLWDFASGAEIARFGEGNSLLVICELPDGRIASGSHDGQVQVWDPATGAETARFEGDRPISVLCALPDGRLASGSAHGVQVWDLATGVEAAKIENDWEWVRALCALPDGRLAFVVHQGARRGSGLSQNNSIWLWDPAGGAELTWLTGRQDSVNNLCLLPDGRLASGAFDGAIVVWDLATGAEIARMEGHERGVSALCALPDGRLASGSWDNTIRLWDPVSGAETARLGAHEGVADYYLIGTLYGATNTLCALPDGRLASGGYGDCAIRLWEPDRGSGAARWGWFHGQRPGPDGRFAASSWTKTLPLTDPVSGARIARLEEHWGWTGALCATPDGRVVSCSNDIRLWDSASGAEIARFPVHDFQDSDIVSKLCCEPDGRSGLLEVVTSLAMLPDGRLASASDDGVIQLWDLARGIVVGRLNASAIGAVVLDLLPDGRLALGSEDGLFQLWDVERKTKLSKFGARVKALHSLPNGRLATAGSDDGAIRLWRCSNRDEVGRLYGHESQVNALCLLPGGVLASGSMDHTVRLWSLAGHAETACLQGHRDQVNALCALPDGRLVSGSSDRTIRVWNPASGAEITRFEVESSVFCFCLAPAGDGYMIVAGNSSAVCTGSGF